MYANSNYFLVLNFDEYMCMVYEFYLFSFQIYKNKFIWFLNFRENIFFRKYSPNFKCHIIFLNKNIKLIERIFKHIFKISITF